jgi:hypothetical protein
MIPEEQSNQDTTRLVYTISTKKSTKELRQNTTALVHASRAQTESFKSKSFCSYAIFLVCVFQYSRRLFLL